MSHRSSGSDSGVIEEITRLDESHIPIPHKHLSSYQMKGPR
jgi:hypothetical protein